MEIEERRNKICDIIYNSFGSSTGYLFGIEPRHKDAVKVIIKLVLEYETNSSGGKK